MFENKLLNYISCKIFTKILFVNYATLLSMCF